MAREQLTFYNASSDGQGLEGFINWSNTAMDFYLIPLFLFTLYGLGLYIASRNQYKFGGQLALISLGFFIVGMIIQAFTQFNQIVMFMLALGLIVGIVMSFMENAK